MDAGNDDSGKPVKRRRQSGPRFEATMEAKRLVPLTVDFYNRLLFSEAFEKAVELSDRFMAEGAGPRVGRENLAEQELGKFLTQWTPPFKGLVS